MSRALSAFCVVGLWTGFSRIRYGWAFSSNDMVRLRNDLLSNYSVGVLPLRNQSTSLPVNMSFFLIMIHNLNMKNQIMTASGWLKFEWCDEFLQWSPDTYGGIDELILFQKDVWLPDIFVENTAQHYRELGNNQMLISVKSSGMVHWEPGIITETSCAVNIGKYPFDTQVCDIRFLTWMHTNKTLTVEPELDVINLDALLPNGEWDITKTEANVYRYPSTYRPGTDHTGVTFVVHLRRKRFFYVLNTIIPVVMLSCLNVLVFILPSDCGERMALAVTVLLAFTVYLGIISDNIPKTSESLSLLAIYLTSLLALSTASVVCAGIVLNIHYRDPSLPVPRVFKWMFSSSSSSSSSSSGSPPETHRPSASSFESQRTSLTHWERYPALYDQRRPSIWARRLTLKGSRSQSRGDNHSDEKHDDKTDVGLEAEKQQPFMSSVSSPSRENYGPAYKDISYRELQSQGSGDDDNVTYSGKGSNVQYLVEANSRIQNKPVGHEFNTGQLNHTYANKTVSYDSVPCIRRGVSFNSLHTSQPGESDIELSVTKRKDTPLDKVRQCKPSHRNHYNARNIVQSEVHCLLNEQNKQTSAESDDSISWHDIGNSLDRTFFWVFFLVTNTVTVVILVLFVKNDA